MLKLTILQQMLVVSIALSVITCALVQKTKQAFKNPNLLSIYSFLVNMVLGVLFCKTFTSVPFPESLWVGLFSFIGADTIYKTLEGKLKSYSTLVEKSDMLSVPKKNLIKTGSEK